jgi:cyclopropane fatty-acyl-phospholipid synthase-like methyltransferase
VQIILNNDRVTEAYYGEIFASSTKQFLRERIDWMVNQAKGENILDIGCSQGIVSILLARDGKKVLGIDISDDAIQYAETEKQKEAEAVQRNLVFTSGDIFEMQVKEKYHTVIMGEILEHLDNPAELITLVSELLEDDGRLILTIPFGVNDHDDHQHTFYISSILDLVKGKFSMNDIKIIGKWLCVSVNKKGNAELNYEVFLKASEQAFYRIEQDYLESKYKRDTRINELSTKLKDRQEKVTKLQNVYHSYPYRMGKIIISGLRPGKNMVLMPFRIMKLIVEMKKDK